MPIVIIETGASATGAYNSAQVLYRNPNDPEHATEHTTTQMTGRNFNWDADTNKWVDSASGRGYAMAGYLCNTPGPSATAQNAQGAQPPQAPGGPQDSGVPIVIIETGASATGAYNSAQVLYRNPNDAEHATEHTTTQMTGRNFNWDADTNKWVDSATGQSYAMAGYLCNTPGPEAAVATATSTPQTPSPQAPPAANTAKRPTPSSSQTSMSTTGAGIQFQLRGFGGASFINGNTPSAGGLDGGVFFPITRHFHIGPSAGFQWINSSIVNSIGSQQPGSTFINTSAGFKNGNFGGTAGFPFGGWQLGIQGGATVANATITQQSGFCGLGNATSPAGCTVASTTTTHDTVIGPFVGGYISHSIFNHIGAFVGYDWNRLKITLPSSGGPTSTQTTLDLNQNTIEAGFTFYVGDLLKH